MRRKSNVQENYADKGELDVIIEKGIIKSGVIDRSTVGKTAGGLINIIYNEYGNEYATKLINCTQRFINHWLTYHGFSIGVKDIVPNKKPNDRYL